MWSEDKLYAVGYPDIGGGQAADGLSAVYEARTELANGRPGSHVRFLHKFKDAHVVKGFSGAPLISLRKLRAIGVVSHTRSSAVAIGGWAIPVDLVLSEFGSFFDDHHSVLTPSPRWTHACSRRRRILERRKSGPRPKGRVERLRDLQKDEQDLLRLYKLQKKRGFTPDPINKMKYWLSIPDSDSFREMVFVLKFDDNVVGYLFAQHYITEETIFISYIDVDEGVKEVRSNGYTRLLRKLITTCDQAPAPWKRIIGEVDEKDSEYLLHFFNSDAKRLKAPLESGLFILDLDYFEPAIKPGAKPSGLKHKIIYFSRDTRNLIKKASGSFSLSQEEVKLILNIVILRVYGDGYKKNHEYQKDLRNEVNQPRVSGGVDLLDVDSDMP